MVQTLTVEQSYDAMIYFLETYNKKINSIDIALLTSDLLLLPDNMSVDPAAVEDWYESVERILKIKKSIYENLIYRKSISLTINQAYDTMLDYLEGYYERTTSEDVDTLISKMKLSADNRQSDYKIWNDWSQSVKKTLKKEQCDRPYSDLPDINLFK